MIRRRDYPAEIDLFNAGFYRLWLRDNGSMFYRWHGDVREEVALCFDRVGRLAAWSVWHNKRVKPPVQEAGRRERLIEWLSEDAT